MICQLQGVGQVITIQQQQQQQQQQLQCMHRGGGEDVACGGVAEVVP